jgi:hypothetical protein
MPINPNCTWMSESCKKSFFQFESFLRMIVVFFFWIRLFIWAFKFFGSIHNIYIIYFPLLFHHFSVNLPCNEVDELLWPYNLLDKKWWHSKLKSVNYQKKFSLLKMMKFAILFYTDKFPWNWILEHLYTRPRHPINVKMTNKMTIWNQPAIW